jgi:antirestriction protein ArdC
MTTPTPRRNLHAEITNQLIAAIEANPGEPCMPWRQAGMNPLRPINALTGKRYNGINVLSLWSAAQLNRFELPFWGTYKQWAEKGAQVRKGEKSSLVVFYKDYDVEPDTDDEKDDGRRRVARASYVFNADQVDGFERPEAPASLGPIERMTRADAFTASTGADIRLGGARAYYRPDTDHIQMPDEGLFTGTGTMTRSESYYGVLVHELVHWTGAKHRLARDMSGRFKTASYAAEELVAEIGAAFLCSDLGITQDVRPDHAQYLAHWLQLLKEDDHAIFAAAARASEAVTYLEGLTS